MTAYYDHTQDLWYMALLACDLADHLQKFSRTTPLIWHESGAHVRTAEAYQTKSASKERRVRLWLQEGETVRQTWRKAYSPVKVRHYPLFPVMVASDSTPLTFTNLRFIAMVRGQNEGERFYFNNGAVSILCSRDNLEMVVTRLENDNPVLMTDPLGYLYRSHGEKRHAADSLVGELNHLFSFFEQAQSSVEKSGRHIRRLTGPDQHFVSGADTPPLCEAAVVDGWDLTSVVTPDVVADPAKNVCPTCARAFLEKTGRV